jgi:hypothetical protein
VGKGGGIYFCIAQKFNVRSWNWGRFCEDFNAGTPAVVKGEGYGICKRHSGLGFRPSRFGAGHRDWKSAENLFLYMYRM